MSTKPIVVLGATGKTGRRVVERLAARGVPVRAAGRSSQPPFDWEAPATWAPALQGAGPVYVTYYPDLAAPSAPDAIRALAGAAVSSGVPRLVLLSGRGEPEAQRCEQIVRESGTAWTLVRAAWFAQNFSESYLLEGILAGSVTLPAGDVGEPFVDADDIADVAVAALTEERHAGQLYEVTGPRLLTFAQAVAEIGRATGREIRYARVSPQAYAAAMKEAGLPQDVVDLVTYLFTEVLDGRNQSIADGVARALGRPARDFADYARAAAAAGAWNVPS
jgi:uncharacterized protein YbjT (DUF2867 family)